MSNQIQNSSEAKDVQRFYPSIYEKVYIINFDKCSQIPCLTNEELKKLGKWYVSTGKEWICHSDYELEEFKNYLFKFYQS